METFFFTGIQQVGVGTVNLRKSWDWHIDMFGADLKILEDNTVAERMFPYTGNKPQRRHACITMNIQGGAGWEIWQYAERKPVECPFEISVGDLGILAAKIKSKNVVAFRNELSKKWKDCSEIETLPDGTPCFYVKDLYGNWFQVVERKDVFINQNKLCGGIVGAVIGVSDMDKSIEFYGKLLGYNIILSDTTGPYSTQGFLLNADKKCRRVILGAPKRHGAFSALLGDSTIELVQNLEIKPRKIYEGRFWGDPGFIQICFDVVGMRALGKFCEKMGHPFTVDSCPGGERFDMGDAAGHFTYIEDPDGTLIEFVETHRIPIVKKLGWFIDLGKRNPKKPLPKFLYRLMALVSKEKSQQSYKN